MTATKFSRQRESIKSYLASTKEHPTADMIYMHIRNIYPNISLGTVYRNLNLLVEQGEIIKVSHGSGSDRFDSNSKPHYHFICTKCSCVEDIMIPDETLQELYKVASNSEGFEGKIEGNDTFFYGLCKNCKDAQE